MSDSIVSPSMKAQLKTSSSTIVVTYAYLAALAGAESVGVLLGIVPGILCQALLILVLLTHYASVTQAPYRRLLPVLALVSLLRVLSVIMPIRQLPQIYWYVVVGIPALIAVVLTGRLINYSWTALSWRRQPWNPQILIALSGLPLSVVAFFILRPRPLAVEGDWLTAAIGSVVLLLFASFTEEIIFRGMLLRTAGDLFGPAGMLYSSLVFASMYISSLSLGYILFNGLMGFFFSWCVRRTGLIWGVVVAHGLVLIGMAFVWPFVMQ